ncbi:uncharacterized protein MONOS_5503 [Monocercomonoides exilis]|uniref:uncharacterized protein n=1 Tax=Monocercomonoides exilis TaxID=2049356 RepID=UPI0035598700|nr:hypothetical protein MONOS_5503 [Monocercomonoides exilis]|eukprot:MONOS_5503.1-p1 / transcript=MONOS_5503.1 / gene=MONOS_5503 / organism=Monocercomonoides_exilis_PA203 / gene_product=unspecified product / transcript_product=unspecified product / location=Mono_scaffold00161:67185-67463(-) / protein_length=93 / sequence_SO=supercontig / SO=protein_coding / is_pseudo=false
MEYDLPRTFSQSGRLFQKVVRRFVDSAKKVMVQPIQKSMTDLVIEWKEQLSRAINRVYVVEEDNIEIEMFKQLRLVKVLCRKRVNSLALMLC